MEKTVAPIVSTPEVAVGEPTQHVEIEGPSTVLIEVPADGTAEPLREGVEIVSLNSLSSERTQSAGSEEVLQPKTSEELAKELTLSDEILEQVVAQVRGKVVDAANVTLPSTPVEDVRPEEEKKTSGEEVKTLEVTFLDFLQDSVVTLLQYLDRKRGKYAISKERAREQAATLVTECAASKATLKEREAQLREKEIECEVLQLNLEKESGHCAELEETCGGLRKSNENEQKMFADLLTSSLKPKSEEPKKFVSPKTFGKIAEVKKAEEELRSKIAGKCDMEFQRAEELSASLAEENQKHEEELKNCAKKLADCELTKSSKIKCRLKVESECRRLREQLGKADMRSEESRRRMEKAEEAYHQLRDESTDELKLHLEKCLNGFTIWGLQTVKWLKLDSLKRRLMSAKTNGSEGHK
ncbi:hypothetical protein AXG93_2035s1790 [Marchantia polymorpha subsp. ruderalis]|uniref:Uncharacterized protein n=1 Tax=Marchantia polymorpha subsp. ruderalis TaxID=1480154 RepID=A0A176VRX6_MARPO|nr:hypothetical protein AXG93_2035s1790 [Marchantia polymorpha subsp. ruderalis]